MKKIPGISVLLLVTAVSVAQITGPSPVNQYQNNNYTFNNGVIYPSYTWGTGGGTIISSSRVGTTYYLTVVWNSPGTITLVFLDNTYTVRGSKIVTVNACSLPANPSGITFTPSSNTCGDKTITRNGAPPSGVTWYWQTSTSGTSESNSTTSYIATASGTFYIRAKNSCGWSTGTASTGSITVNPNPATPGTPTASTNTCYAKTLNKNGTPPGGVSWYWQGTNSAGQDYTSGSATGTTYSAAIHGTNTYYISARSTAGCWSSGAGLVVGVDNPSPPNAANYTFCEFESMAMTPSGALTTIKWYNTSGTLIHTGLTYTPADLNNGSYTYNVKNMTANCESTNSSAIGLTVTDDCDTKMNWNETIGYGVNTDGTPKELSNSRSYADGFGKVIQAQSKSYVSSTQVFAAENIYDNEGNLSLSTLPAPLNRSTFSYRHRFVTNPTGQKYSANDFDLGTTSGASGEVTNPKTVSSNGQGTLGWYYSTSNTSEILTPVTSFPYSRSWTEIGPNPLISKSAGPGDNYRMGTSHEVKTEKQLWTTNELSHYYSIKTHFASNSVLSTSVLGHKIITTDPDGKKSVVFTDGDGSTLATAIINTSQAYDYWSYVFYNDMGQVVAEVAPNGVNTGSTAYPSFVTTYKYDHLGRLIETTSPDDGTSKFVYSLDGKIRFSQSQEQRNASPARFSYTNYDYLGALIESGEYTMSGTGYYVFEGHDVATPASNSVLTIVENTGYTGITKKSDPNSRCSDFTYVEYDRQALDFVTDTYHTAQNNLLGAVSKTENAEAKTWYSYDEFGQLEWTKQSITDLGYKTIDYTYDNDGNVTQVVYQKGQSDDFYHHYTYDANLSLTHVKTSLDGTTQTLHALYKYYLHGPLKRVELATNKQGIDFVYTITGALKGINHADNDGAKDPGLDGVSGSPNASFTKDVFGQNLIYHDNDYTGAGYSAGSVTLSTSTFPYLYGGNPRAITYNNSTELAPTTSTNQERVYAFQYDQVNQFTNAQYGTVTNTSSPYSTSLTEEHREQITGYDKNGNIQGLTRKGKAPSIPTTANYDYDYETNNNRLDKVNIINGPVMVDYTYNAVGQMITQVEGSKTMNVTYNAYGLVKEIRDDSSALVLKYAYDDRGDLVKKTYYTSGTASKNLFYVNDASGNVVAIYEQALPSGSAQLIEVPVYGAGRVASYKPLVGSGTFFYEVTDHLGNVRAVIGQPSPATYTATMETENASTEEPPFKNVGARRVTFVGANNTPGGNEVVRMNNTLPAGPAIILPVSPGDKIDIDTYAYYEAGSNYNNIIDATTMINAIATAFGGVSGGGEAGQIWSNVQSGFAGTLGSSGSSTLPAAFLTYVVYDKNFAQLVWGSTGVTSAGNLAKEHLVQPQVTIEQPGYIYICLYNRSNSSKWVYFDDLKVVHTQSTIVAGADYYPFGLVMDGREITDEAYRYGYQGQFSEKDNTNGWNEFELRMYDSRFGRWLSMDPYGQFASPYLSMGNNPVSGIDPDGGWSLVGSAIGVLTGIGLSFAFGDEDNWYLYAIGGFAAGGIIGELAHSSHSTQSKLANGWDRFTSIFGEGVYTGSRNRSYAGLHSGTYRRYGLPKWRTLAMHTDLTWVGHGGNSFQKCVYAAGESSERWLGGHRTRDQFAAGQNGGSPLDRGTQTEREWLRFWRDNFRRNFRGAGNTAPTTRDIVRGINGQRLYSVMEDKGDERTSGVDENLDDQLSLLAHNFLIKGVQVNRKTGAIRYVLTDPNGSRMLLERKFRQVHRLHVILGR